MSPPSVLPRVSPSPSWSSASSAALPFCRCRPPCRHRRPPWPLAAPAPAQPTARRESTLALRCSSAICPRLLVRAHVALRRLLRVTSSAAGHSDTQRRDERAPYHDHVIAPVLSKALRWRELERAPHAQQPEATIMFTQNTRILAEAVVQDGTQACLRRALPPRCMRAPLGKSCVHVLECRVHELV